MDSGSLYKALGVASAATDADIRTAYRRRALATHPDKGGSAEAFRLVVARLLHSRTAALSIRIVGF